MGSIPAAFALKVYSLRARVLVALPIKYSLNIVCYAKIFRASKKIVNMSKPLANIYAAHSHITSNSNRLNPRLSNAKPLKPSSSLSSCVEQFRYYSIHGTYTPKINRFLLEYKLDPDLHTQLQLTRPDWPGNLHRG